jgi:GNAT superfamily N-acetyltransferase
MSERKPQYQTRPATSEDEPFLYDCYKRTMRDHIQRTWGWNEEFQRSSFAQYLPWRRFQVIMLDSTPAGGACVLDTTSSMELELIVVDPPFQRLGIGSDLVTNLACRAQDRGVRLMLRVLRVNPAKALYERLGFVTAGGDDHTIEMQAVPYRECLTTPRRIRLPIANPNKISN